MDQGYKLYYFGGNARAVLIRAIFYATKKPFEDIKLDYSEWLKMKTSGKFEFQQVPILEYQGRSYTQSHAIEQYLGKSFNLMGKSIEDDYQISSIIASFDDVFAILHDIIMPLPNKPIEEVKKRYQEKVELYFQCFEKRYQMLGNGKYYLGDYFSLADIALTTMFTYFAEHDVEEGLLKKFSPKLNELFERIKSNELKEYYEKGYIKESKY